MPDRTKHIELGKKINKIDEALKDIRFELADTNILSVKNKSDIKRNKSHIEELAKLIGVIKSFINYKLNNNTHNSSYKTVIEQWAEHLDSMGNNSDELSTIDEDVLADSNIYLGRGGNKKKKTRKKRKRKTKKKRKSRKRKKTKKRRKKRK